MMLDGISAEYRPLLSEKPRPFNGRLRRWAVVGSIFALGVLAIGIAASLRPESRIVLSTVTPSFQDQHALAHLEGLPVHQFEDLTFVFTADPSARESVTVSSSSDTAKQ